MFQFKLVFIYLLVLNVDLSIQYLKIQKANPNENKDSISSSTSASVQSTTIYAITDDQYDIENIFGDIDHITTLSSTTLSPNKEPTTELTTSTIPTSKTTISPTYPIFPPILTNLKKSNQSKKNEKHNKQKSSIKHLKSKNYFCECDLRPDYCNINCCCDVDCNDDMIKTFECEFPDPLEYDYQYGLPPCNINDGWFCVTRENINKEPITKFNPDLIKQRQKYEWKSPLLFTDEPKKSLEHYYKYQEPLKVYTQQTEEVEDLELPFPLMGQICNTFEPVRHMVNTEYSCLLSNESYNFFVKELQDKLYTSFLLKTKKETTDFMVEHCNDDKFEYCSKIQMFSCVQININSLSECRKIENSTDFLEVVIYDKIELVVQHNYTHLNYTNIFFYTKEDKDNSKNSNHISLDIKIQFKIFNETTVESVFPSIGGPLGYKLGLPIIKGYKILLNESAEESDKIWILDYFHPERIKLNLKDTLNLLTSSEGVCHKMESNELLINFGENSIATCEINFNNPVDSKNSNQNFEIFCNNLQSRIFDHLLNIKNISSNYEIFISEFGNPKNDSKYWTKVELKNYEPIQILGEYITQSETFLCKNIILGIKIGFLSARLNVQNIPNQNIIKSVFYEFEPRVNLEFKLNEPIKFPIFSSIMFYDVTDSSKSLYTSKLLFIIIYPQLFFRLI